MKTTEDALPARLLIWNFKIKSGASALFAIDTNLTLVPLDDLGTDV